jgi:RNA polymerase sigma-70 factor, ECF subfamily
MRVPTRSSPRPDGEQRELLDAARLGDQEAFRGLVEPHRAELHAHCYRVLGSHHDAEDALQDALLLAWRGLGRFEGRGELRSWLYTIATNASLDALARRAKRFVPVEHVPLADSDSPEPEMRLPRSVWQKRWGAEGSGVAGSLAAPGERYERREAVALAFIAARQHLPRRQRIVLVLRDVLGFSVKEVGQRLDSTAASVNSALQRAHRALDELPQKGGRPTLRALGDSQLRGTVESFIDAFECGEVDAILELLAEDAA